ncbi:cell division protein ZapA [Sphingomonas sp.]|uniref:cell division protein ZapA n=1 Tax=Sphingomonas sp. TaxID=28214 RepID=UPI00286CF9D5|nr:cell division protein ZapA [Sphingomonas sp.]
MAEVNLTIAGRSYQVGCRAGEEENLVAAARMVDAKSREALSGLGTLSESRQLLFASLLLADQLLEKPGAAAAMVDPELAPRIEALAERIEALAKTLEDASVSA